MREGEKKEGVWGSRRKGRILMKEEEKEGIWKLI